ncbi:MAG: type II toxin-antitoxin system VapB family antitoxin [Actinobacteria bacterium]|nr:type II toxin-antitoxin system VapB family antitoxin [Actinomycetota bacterium]MBE3114356.1 type II toxin-antitoxin system VapB family antitoxin [Actinomycetota bacterium]
MRTNIDLDDKLVKEAFNYANVSTKKELINLALKEFVKTYKRLNPKEIKGEIKFEKDYDYKKLREGR